MNLREFIAKCKSPSGITIITVTACVILAFLLIPFLKREDDDAISIKRSGLSKEMLTIEGNTKLFRAEKSNERRSVKQAPKQNPAVLNNSKDEKKVSPKPPVPPRPPVHKAKSFSPYRRSSSKSFSNRPRKNYYSKPKVKRSIVIIDGENSKKVKKVFLSRRYAPMGRLISCRLVNTLESLNGSTPLIGMVTEDLWWINQKGEKKLIIPVGTEVHGTVSGKATRNRLMSSTSFTFIWQITNEMVGFELQLSGIALEKSHDPSTKSLATISDMSAGIPGRVISNDNLTKMMMYTFAFTQGLAEGFQTTSVASNSSSTILAYEGTTKNAVSRAFANLSQIALQDLTQQVAKESYFIRVPAGTEFYVYVTQVIDLSKAQVADTLLNQLEKKKLADSDGRKKPFDASKILNAFSKKNKNY